MEIASVKKFEKPEAGSDLELRSCPFCGGTEVVYAMYNRLALGERWAAICMDCMAEIDPGWAQTKSAVQALWNRRDGK